MRLGTTLRSTSLAFIFFACLGSVFAQADLSLTLTQQPATPQQYSFYTVSATITNDGPEDATNVLVSLPLPEGVVYEGGNEFTASAGSFSAYGDQTWTLPTIGEGESETLAIRYFLRVVEAPAGYAQVVASDQSDPDSSPLNGTPPTVNEDDEASTLINGGFVPDLTLSNLVLVQVAVDSGAQIDFTFDINNLGAGSIAQNFLVQAFISTDEERSADDVQNGTVPTGSFDPGQTVTGVVGASVPVGLSPGNYFLILEADANGQVLESNETNNTIAVPLEIRAVATQVCAIDLQSTTIVCDDNGTVQDPSDDIAIVEVVAENAGGSSFTIEDLTGVVVAAGTYGSTVTFTVPLFNNQNRLLNYVIVDDAEAETCTAPFTVTGPSVCSPDGPDLQVANLRLDAAGIQANGDLGFTFDLTNAGATAIAQTFLVQAYLSVDSILSVDDLQNGTIPTGSFGPMQTVSDIVGAANVSSLAPGDYFLILLADANRQVAEVLEDNNISNAVPFTVPAVSDLIDLSVEVVQTPNQPEQYSFYTVTVTVENAGPQSATGVVVDIPRPAGVVYRGGGEFSATQGLLSIFGANEGEWTVGTIPAGGRAEMTVKYFLRTADVPNSYVQVLAANEEDSDSTPGNGTAPTVNEDDEASTLINGGFVPDLTLTNLVLAQNPIAVGQQIDFTFDINNIGAGSIAQNFLVQAYISRDEVISADDLQNGTVPTGSFDAGQTVEGVVGASVPVGLTPGDYFLILDADANGQVLESNESNNTIAVPFTIESGVVSGGTCDALDEYEASLAAPTKVSVRTDSVGIIQVTYLSPTGLDSFTFDGPAALGVTPVADNTFEADDIMCTSNGMVITGTYRDAVAPGNAQPFVIQLDESNAVVVASIPFTSGGFNDLLAFTIIDVATSGPDGDVIFLEAFSFGRSYQIAAIDASNNVLWEGQRIGDLVTNRIGGSVLSADESLLYFSYRDGNSQSWPRLRGVDVTDGSTLWEVQLGNIVSGITTAITGDVSAPFAFPNGGVGIGFTAQNVTELMSYVAKFNADGDVVFLSSLSRSTAPNDNLYSPVFLSSDGELVSVSGTAPIVLAEDGSRVNCEANTGVDLELSAVSTSAQPEQYDVNNITFTLTNTGGASATGVTVSVPRPEDVRYTGGNEFTASQGSLNTFDTFVWTVGDLAPGATASLVVNYFSLVSTGYTQYAEVLSMNEVDEDSTPGNGNGMSPSEDDEVFLDLTNSATSQQLTFFPNPVPQGEQVVLDFISSGETTQTMIFSDLTGRPVRTIQVAFQEGRNQLPVDLGMLPSGIYVVAFPASGLAPKRIIVQE